MAYSSIFSKFPVDTVVTNEVVVTGTVVSVVVEVVASVVGIVVKLAVVDVEMTVVE